VGRVLDEAVRRLLVVVLHYTGADGRVSERAVEPVALAATRGHWYLLAWCRARKGPRWFRTDRFTAAHLTAEPAPTHDATTMFGTPPDDAHPVRLR
jgi:predicted DNA-binding transcriptional regulator YafY